MPRPYYALNGQEIIEIIKAEVELAMNNTGKFTLARAYPQVSWKWKLEMEVYPAEPSKFEVESHGHKKVSDPKHAAEKLSVEGGRTGIGESVSPDQVRVESKMPLMHPVAKKTGIVDELMDSLK